jgi:hypothetical protein
MLYGTALPRGDYERQHDVRRSVIGEITTSIAGNVILRIGREHEPGGSWHLAEHVTLTPDEARSFAAAVLDASGHGDDRPRAALDREPIHGDR